MTYYWRKTNEKRTFNRNTKYNIERQKRLLGERPCIRTRRQSLACTLIMCSLKVAFKRKFQHYYSRQLRLPAITLSMILRMRYIEHSSMILQCAVGRYVGGNNLLLYHYYFYYHPYHLPYHNPTLTKPRD